MGLILDENHIYRLDGEIIPGYSEIAKAEGLIDYSGIPTNVLVAAQKFGTAVHLMTALWDKGILNITTLDKNLMPYLNGYRKFLSKHNVFIYPEWIETPTYSKKWRYGVTPDRMAVVDKKFTDYEIKSTTKMQPSIRIQTVAQKIAIEEQTKIKIKQRIGLQLLPEDYRLEYYNNVCDERIWISAVTLYHFKKEHIWKQ